MKLTEAQSREILTKHGVYVTEACDKCGRLLGSVRYTRFGEAGEWCSRECRDGAEAAAKHSATRKGGRPRKYETERARMAARRSQTANHTREWRTRLDVSKNHLASA